MSQEYTPEEIRALTGREAVRFRPGMYVGDNQEFGLHNLVYELVDNSIEEAVAGYGDKISVIIHPDNSITVEDNGRGLPIATHESGKPIAEIIMTDLHAEKNFHGSTYRKSVSFFGIGAICVNFLSEWLQLQVWHDGKVYKQKYQKGLPLVPVIRKAPSHQTGTKISFKPDAEIFVVTQFEWNRLASKLQQKAFLNKNIQITLRDERTTSRKTLVLFFKAGVADYIRHLNVENQTLHPDPIYFERKATELISRDEPIFSEIRPTEANISLEIALQYINSGDKNVLAFANQIPNPDGGTHVSGLYAGLTRAINQYGTSVHLMHSNAEFLDGRDTRAGLVAVIAVSLPCPQYAGSTKAQLASKISGIVESFVYQSVKKYFEENPAEAQNIITHLVHIAQIRKATKTKKKPRTGKR